MSGETPAADAADFRPSPPAEAALPRRLPAPPTTLPIADPSAGSGELLCERRQELAAIVVAQPLRQLCAGELALRLDHGALAVRPARLDRVQPRALARQAADQETAPGAGGLDPAVVLPDPRADLAADVPGGVVPDQHQG